MLQAHFYERSKNMFEVHVSYWKVNFFSKTLVLPKNTPARKAKCRKNRGVGAALGQCLTFSKNSRRKRPTRFHVEESTQAPWHSVEECECRWYPCQRTWTLRMNILKFFGFLTEACANYPILTQEVMTGDNTEYWAPTWCNWNQEAVTSFVRVWNGGHVWCHQVAAEKKSPHFDFCHCQNLTVPGRARLKLVHPSRLVQRKSLVSRWKEVEHCTQSRTHAMIQKIDHRMELSTGKCCRHSFACCSKRKKSNSGPYPNSDETPFEQYAKQ